jgi:hypothetical protein
VTAIARPELGYRYLPAIDAFSAGVAAQDGFAIGRLDLAGSPSLPEGFARVDRWLAEQSLAATAIVATHLRSPVPVDDSGFTGVNDSYRMLLAERGILHGEVNPVARSNVAPVSAPPRRVTLAAAFVVVPDSAAAGDFVAAGAAETAGPAVGTAAVVALGDVTPAGLRRKVDVVLETMLRRLSGLGAGPEQPTTINVYTAHDIARLHEQIAARIGAVEQVGFRQWAAYPPVLGMEFEMDVHRVSWTRVIAG